MQHETVKNRCVNSRYITRFPPEIRRFAERFVQMQSSRHVAYYDPAATFDRQSVEKAIRGTTAVISEFESASEKHRRAFAVYVTAPLNR